MINAQCALKDVLRWKLGLRNPERLQIERLGVKCFNLARNKLGCRFASKVATALATDVYNKSINL